MSNKEKMMRRWATAAEIRRGCFLYFGMAREKHGLTRFSILGRLWRNEKQNIIDLPHLILLLCSIPEAGDSDAAAAAAASPLAALVEMVLAAFAAWA